jgi:transcriptional regulator with XRE-family HTH domain
MGGWHLSHVAPKFERLLETYRREDGGKWSGVELERATGGVLTRSYVSNLRKGRIENPGMDKLAAIAKAMGFPPGLWFEEEPTGADGRGAAGTREELAVRVERLFDAIKDTKTGETYTNSKIARMSLGDLTEEDVEGLRSGSVADPPLSHLLALARAFGVEPSYLVDGTGEAALDREMVEALRDDTTRAIAREGARLPARERNLVLGIVRQFEGAGSREGDDLGGAYSGGR